MLEVEVGGRYLPVVTYQSSGRCGNPYRPNGGKRKEGQQAVVMKVLWGGVGEILAGLREKGLSPNVTER